MPDQQSRWASGEFVEVHCGDELSHILFSLRNCLWPTCRAHQFDARLSQSVCARARIAWLRVPSACDCFFIKPTGV